MSEPSRVSPEQPGADAAQTTGSDDLARLRRLILAVEQQKLAELEHRLNDPDTRAEELSRVLPEALARAAREDNRLGLALSTVLDEALAASIRKNRRHLADSLAPAMGPAIRRAIAEALRAMVDSFNQVFQRGLSPRAIGWRLEAWRTGRPFAEIVLRHSLLFRVEQVFLVHRRTGLLLQHVAADPAAARDGDLVSGMLTAIQDFIRDSFSVDAAEAVDTMRVGDLTVWVEQGEDAYLAAVIRGTPPVTLRSVLRDALEAIHLELGDLLAAFSGDATPFEEARPHLEGCLQMQVAGGEQRRYWLAPAMVGGAVLLLLVAWAAVSLKAGARWNAYLARLAAEPGIVVVSQSGGVWRQSIAGLADPHAASPLEIAREFGLDPSRMTSRWESHVSQQPAVVLRRARAALQPPSSVTLMLKNGTLVASGSAPHRWILAARTRATAVPGVLSLDISNMTDEGLAAIAPIQRRLEALVLRFDVGSAELPPREAAVLNEAAAALRELVVVASSTGVVLRVDVVGHTDGTGSEATNVRLSRARAEYVLSALEARGVRDVTFAVVGVGASRPLRPETSAENRAYNRSVTFHVFPET